MNESLIIDQENGVVNVTIPEWTETKDSGRSGQFNVHYLLEILDGAWRHVEKKASERVAFVTGLKTYTTYYFRLILARRTIGNVLVSGPAGPSFNFTTDCGGKR